MEIKVNEEPNNIKEILNIALKSSLYIYICKVITCVS